MDLLISFYDSIVQRRLTTSTSEIASVKNGIEILSKPFEEMYVEEQCLHDAGSVSRVYKARSVADGGSYVVKVNGKGKLRAGDESDFRRMATRMLNCPDVPNVVKVLACYEDEQYFYTVFENLSGGDLFPERYLYEGGGRVGVRCVCILSRQTPDGAAGTSPLF